MHKSVTISREKGHSNTYNSGDISEEIEDGD